MKPFEGGLVAELVTPADAELGFDGKSFARLFERVLESADGMFVNSVSAGEALFLPPAASREVISLSLGLMGGRKPLFVGISAERMEDVESNIKFVEEEISRREYCGEVFLADAPLCYRGNRGMAEHYDRLALGCRLPFIILNDPSAAAIRRSHFRRRNIRTNVLKKTAMNPAVAGLAHNGSLNRLLNYMRAVRHREDFLLLDADETNFLDSPGSGGVISAGANLLPEKWKLIVESSCGADEQKKRDEDYRRCLIETMRALKSLLAAYRPDPPGLVKAGLKALGVISSDAVFGKAGPAEGKNKDCLISLLLENAGFGEN